MCFQIRLRIAAAYPAWCSRNDDLLSKFARGLDVNLSHLPRSFWCKASHDMKKFKVKCAEDSATPLGVMLLAVSLCSHQNAKVELQTSYMKLLRGLFSVVRPTTIPTLRDQDWSHLDVLENGLVSLDSFKSLLRRAGLGSRLAS
jgi:hypothetical protein